MALTTERPPTKLSEIAYDPLQRVSTIRKVHTSLSAPPIRFKRNRQQALILARSTTSMTTITSWYRSEPDCKTHQRRMFSGYLAYQITGPGFFMIGNGPKILPLSY